MYTLILAATVLGLSSAYPQNLRNADPYTPSGPKIAYEYHDVHQSPIPAIRQTHVNADAAASAVHQAQQFQQQSEKVVVPQIGYLQSQPQVAARSVPIYPNVAILNMNQEATYDGNFNYGFQSEDGTQAKASGTVRAIEGSEFPAQVMRGSYSYTAPDGRQVVTNWYADETGFHAEGDHIPAMPEAIQRSVEYLRSLPPYKEEPEQPSKHH